MDCLRKVINLVQQGEWAISIGLADAYLHIPFHVKNQKMSTFMHTGKSLPIHQSLFRSNSSTMEIYEDCVGNCGILKTAKCPSSCIHVSERLIPNIPVKKVVTDRQRKISISSK